MWNGDLSFIPCAITLCNALCGLSAIIYLIRNPDGSPAVPALATWLIFAAMVFDLFDGFVARKLGAESLQGMELDSLADMLSFGVAPATMIYQIGQHLQDYFPAGGWIAWAASGFYAVCAMWRLAHYNTVALSSEDAPKSGFTGLPSPGGALAVCSAMLLLNRLDPDPRTMAIVAVAYALISGFLMVSGFEYMHAKKIVKSGPIVLRVAMLAFALLALMQFGVFAFFALIHLYIFSGPISEMVERSSDWADNSLRKF